MYLTPAPPLVNFTVTAPPDWLIRAATVEQPVV